MREKAASYSTLAFININQAAFFYDIFIKINSKTLKDVPKILIRWEIVGLEFYFYFMYLYITMRYMFLIIKLVNILNIHIVCDYLLAYIL